MSEIQIFKSDAFGRIRTILQDGNILFCGKDVAAALGYTNTKDALSKHCKGVAFRYPLQTPGGTQEARFITEGDVYRLITHSRLPAAEQFESWVFDEVLPSIRKTGSYNVPDLIMEKISLLKELQEELNISKAFVAQADEECANALRHYRECKKKRDQLRAETADIEHQIDNIICWLKIPQGHGERSLK